MGMFNCHALLEGNELMNKPHILDDIPILSP